MDLIKASAKDTHDKEHADENVKLLIQKEQCLVSHAETVQMFQCFNFKLFNGSITLKSWPLKNVNLCRELK